MGYLSCAYSVADETHNTPYVIVVGALNSFGGKASYSTTGSSLWISSYGGESGFNKDYVSESGYQAICTIQL